MLNLEQTKQLDKLLGLHDRGVFTTEQLGEHVSHLITPENVADILERLPVEATPGIHRALSKETDLITDSEILEPEGSPLSKSVRLEYHFLVANLLSQGKDNKLHERASVVCLPSFEPEWAIRLVGGHKQPRALQYFLAETHIWPTGDYGKIPDVPVIRHETSLETELSDAICAVWEKMLARVRYRKTGNGGADGVRYHFACGEMSGHVWCPGHQSATGHLVELSHTLRDFVVAEEDQRREISDRLWLQIEWFRDWK